MTYLTVREIKDLDLCDTLEFGTYVMRDGKYVKEVLWNKESNLPFPIRRTPLANWHNGILISALKGQLIFVDWLSCAFSAPIKLSPISQRAVHSFFVHFALGCFDLRLQRVSLFGIIQIVDLMVILEKNVAYTKRD